MIDTLHIFFIYSYFCLLYVIVNVLLFVQHYGQHFFYYYVLYK